VDSFVDPKRLFTGNPAVVYILPGSETFPPSSHMVELAESHNAPATTFVIRADDDDKKTSDDVKRAKSVVKFKIRWFLGSGVELPLCGHGTLAAAYVLYEKQKVSNDTEISFETTSGINLTVRLTKNNFIEIELPANHSLVEIQNNAKLVHSCKTALRLENESDIVTIYELDGKTSRPKLMIVLDSPERVAQLNPNFAELSSFNEFGIVVTAEGQKEKDSFHFTSRYFAPKANLNEDTATGSIQCALFPYWAAKLGQEEENHGELVTLQCSKRTGWFTGRVEDTLVILGGRARMFAEGKTLIM